MNICNNLTAPEDAAKCIAVHPFLGSFSCNMARVFAGPNRLMSLTSSATQFSHPSPAETAIINAVRPPCASSSSVVHDGSAILELSPLEDSAMMAAATHSADAASLFAAECTSVPPHAFRGQPPAGPPRQNCAKPMQFLTACTK